MENTEKNLVPSAERKHSHPGAIDDITQVFGQLLDLLQKGQGMQEIDGVQQNELKNRLDRTLVGKAPVSVAFSPYAEVLLALARSREKDKVWELFHDYFRYAPHKTYVWDKDDTQEWARHRTCKGIWPDGSIQAPCITLGGKRHLYHLKSGHPELARLWKGEDAHLHRLFIGDLVWLYYMENIGLFQILYRIVEAYAGTGELPISNGSLIKQSKDDVVALVLEAMTRQLEMGTASKTRDRNAAYRIALGWETEQGKALRQSSVMNTSFGTHFHNFIQLAGHYYSENRAINAIRGSSSGSVTVATIITIRDTLKLLQQSFENFDYGRVYHTTLSGIVWTISTIGLIRDLRNTIGIPEVYDTPDEYIPFAYRKLISQEPSTRGEINRYEVNHNCASYARDILLDIEALNVDTADQSKEIETWLSIIEEKVEGYRTAYRTLTGVDLAAKRVAVVPTVPDKKVIL